MYTRIGAEESERIIRLYNDGYGTTEIAASLNRSRRSIQYNLLKNNILLRKRSPYIGKHNVKFFDEYTKESCYWAGFIAADGCVRKDESAVSIHLKKMI